MTIESSQELPRPVIRYPQGYGINGLAYSADGKYLITIGSSFLRQYTVESDDEPETIILSNKTNDEEQPIYRIATSNKEAAILCNNGVVEKYSMEKVEKDGIYTRFSLPVRDASYSNNGKWLAVCSE